MDTAPNLSAEVSSVSADEIERRPRLFLAEAVAWIMCRGSTQVFEDVVAAQDDAERELFRAMSDYEEPAKGVPLDATTTDEVVLPATIWATVNGDGPFDPRYLELDERRKDQPGGTIYRYERLYANAVRTTRFAEVRISSEFVLRHWPVQDRGETEARSTKVPGDGIVRKRLMKLFAFAERERLKFPSKDDLEKLLAETMGLTRDPVRRLLEEPEIASALKAEGPGRPRGPAEERHVKTERLDKFREFLFAAK